MRLRGWRFDLAVGAVLAVLGMVEGATGMTGTPGPWYAVGLVVVVMAGVALRRELPWAAVLLWCGGTAAQAAAGSDLPGGWAEGVAGLVVVYSLGAHLGLRTGLALTALAAGGQALVVVLAGDVRTGNFVYVVTVVAASWLAGRGRRLAIERSELVAQHRVDQERARIARELHDVIAHHVSAIVVQSSAERRGLGADDPAHDVLADVERRGRETLTELRRLLGVLRLDGTDAAPLAPQPRLADLPHLVGSMRDQGLEVRWRSTGEPASIDEGMELAIYRVVQESLTNAGRHAGDRRATVHLAWRPGEVEVEVLSRGQVPRRVPGTGFGLRAMAERVQAYGGEFSARPTDDGFRVRALLPVEVR